MYSSTILDLSLSLPPTSQEYLYLGTPTLGTQQYYCYTLNIIQSVSVRIKLQWLQETPAWPLAQLAQVDEPYPQPKR